VFAALFGVLSRTTLSPSIVGLSITYALNVSQTLNWFVRMSADFETNVTSVERIKEYCETKTHEKEWSIKETRPSADWPSEGNIVFKNYSVKYRENLDNVLNAISMHILPNEKV
jgi:ATP-binding cassette subfamily C (CFTR/MRP) protein 1